MRLAADGRVYVLEVNPNPWLHSTAEFAMAAKKSGRDHAALIEEIVNLALARYRLVSGDFELPAEDRTSEIYPLLLRALGLYVRHWP
jgi:hypothetical protein